MKLLKVISFTILFFNIHLFAQGNSPESQSLECYNLIDMPTAGVLEKGNVGVNFYFMPLGVLISRIEVGVFDNFSFGISYGASNFIGVGDPSWYKLPGVNLKVRIIEETDKTPAIALGFDSQGKGEYFTKYNGNTINRFRFKSPGFYAVMSKNYDFLGFLSLHGMINYSLEKDDGDRDLDIVAGVEKTIGSKISIVGEFDFAINDNSKKSLGDGNGYLNAGVRWSMGGGFTLGFDFRDLLSNKKLTPGSADRALRIDFVKPIF